MYDVVIFTEIFKIHSVLKALTLSSQPLQANALFLFNVHWKWECSVVLDPLWPMDCSPTGFSVHGIFHVRILEWVAISSSRESSPPRDWTGISCVSWISGRFFTVEPLGKPDVPWTRIKISCGQILEIYKGILCSYKINLNSLLHYDNVEI